MERSVIRRVLEPGELVPVPPVGETPADGVWHVEPEGLYRAAEAVTGAARRIAAAPGDLTGQAGRAAAGFGGFAMADAVTQAAQTRSDTVAAAAVRYRDLAERLKQTSDRVRESDRLAAHAFAPRLPG